MQAAISAYSIIFEPLSSGDGRLGSMTFRSSGAVYRMSARMPTIRQSFVNLSPQIGRFAWWHIRFLSSSKWRLSPVGVFFANAGVGASDQPPGAVRRRYGLTPFRDPHIATVVA